MDRTTPSTGAIGQQGRWLRLPAQVSKDFFLKRVELKGHTSRYFARLSDEKYASILEMIDRIKGKKRFTSIAMDNVDTILTFDFHSLPDDFILAQIKGFHLDLTNLKVKWNRYLSQTGGSATPTTGTYLAVLPSDRSGGLIFVIRQEMQRIRDVVANPTATIDRIFAALDRGKNNLGFLNVVVYRPLENGKWIRSKVTRIFKAVDGREMESRYDPDKGGAEPTTTLKSVIEGTKTIFDVDIKDLSTFDREGLIPDRASIANDLATSLGSGRMLFVRITSRYGVEAIVQIHNRVLFEETIEVKEVLPVDPDQASSLKAQLDIYFGEIGTAIERIRERQERLVSPVAEPGRILIPGEANVAYDPEKLWDELQRLSHGVTTRIFRDKTSGRKRPLEIMDLRQLYTLPDTLVEPMCLCLGGIASRAWEGNVRRPVPGYTQEYVLKHFARVTRELLVRDPKSHEIIGFSAVNQLEDRQQGINALMFEAGMIVPKYQSMRVSTVLGAQMFADALLANNLNPVVIPGRTANPQAVGGLHVLTNFFPNAVIPNARPTDEQRRLFDYVANFLNPRENRHEDTFVIDDVYPLESGLIVPPHIIPSYKKDTRVDELCWRSLDYGRFNSPEFYPRELLVTDLGPIIAELKAITSGKIGEIRDEKGFRALVMRTDLYELLKPALDRIKPRAYTKQLADFTAKDRQEEFASLHRDTQENIKYLNRMVLEDLFPALPRRKAKALIIMGEMTIKAQKTIDKKQRRIGWQEKLLSWVRFLANRSG